MNTPLDNRPLITRVDVIRGNVIRYFVQRVSTKRIYEVDNVQYGLFVNNPNYTAIKIPWVISGELETTTRTGDGNTKYGARDKNKHIVEHYNTKMPGLSAKLRNHTEYFTKLS